MTTDNQIEQLNDILTKCYDAEQGFKQVSEKVDNNNLKEICENRSSQRYDFGHEIKGEIKKLGGEVEKGSSVAAGLHRTWIAIKGALSADGNDTAMLEEIIRGEEETIEEYNEALKKFPADSSAYQVLTKQRDTITTMLSTIKAMKVS